MGLMLAEANALDFSAIISGLTSSITPAQIILIISAGVGACSGFVLAWIGVRKLLAMISSAISKGKLRA